MKTFLAYFGFILLVLGKPGIATASLIDNGDGIVTQIRNDATFGDGSELIWLKDTNLAYTSGYWDTLSHSSNNADLGEMTWDQATGWINYLNSMNSGDGYAGYNNWRLPIALPVNSTNYNYDQSYDGSTDVGWNIKSPNSELAYMYYVELGNPGKYDTQGNDLHNVLFNQYGNSGPFLNLEQETWVTHYFTGTEQIDPNGANVLAFWFSGGKQLLSYKGTPNKVWAVRDVAPVPIPSSILLLGFGLASLIGLKKRQKGA